MCAVVRVLRSCACPEKGSREGVRVSFGQGACECLGRCVSVCVVCVRVCGGLAGLRASGGEKKEGGEGVQCACRVVFFCVSCIRELRAD